jgi:hypothetical protein
VWSELLVGVVRAPGGCGQSSSWGWTGILGGVVKAPGGCGQGSWGVCSGLLVGVVCTSVPGVAAVIETQGVGEGHRHSFNLITFHGIQFIEIVFYIFFSFVDILHMGRMERN